MKCPTRRLSRRSICSYVPLRYTKRTDSRSGTPSRSLFRCHSRSAEQAKTTSRLSAIQFRIALFNARSQGSRSSSVRASPLRIFPIFEGGCQLSASSKTQFKRLASASPTTVLPEPDTPMTRMTIELAPYHPVALRLFCIDRELRLAIGIGKLARVLYLAGRKRRWIRRVDRRG